MDLSHIPKLPLSLQNPRFMAGIPHNLQEKFSCFLSHAVYLQRQQIQPRSSTMSYPNVSISQDHIDFVLTIIYQTDEKMFALSYFRPVQHQIMRVRESVSWRLQVSGATRWVMYIGAQIFESLLDGVLPEKTGAYDHWIQRFERELCIIPNRALTNDEIQSRLSGSLEVRPQCSLDSLYIILLIHQNRSGF